MCGMFINFHVRYTATAEIRVLAIMLSLTIKISWQPISGMMCKIYAVRERSPRVKNNLRSQAGNLCAMVWNRLRSPANQTSDKAMVGNVSGLCPNSGLLGFPGAAESVIKSEQANVAVNNTIGVQRVTLRANGVSRRYRRNKMSK